MTEFEILARTVSVIHNGTAHRDYARTVMVAQQAYQYVTGDGLECRLKRIVAAETEEEFAQRRQITRLVAPTVVKRIMDVHLKVPRANSRAKIEYGEGEAQEAREQALKQAVGDFAGDFGSLDRYTQLRYMELNATDPNAWIVTEIGPFMPGQRARPYPFEISSAGAIDFAYDEFILQFLTYKQTKTIVVKGQPKEAADYTVYMRNRTVRFEEIIPDASAPLALEKPNTSQLIDPETQMPVNQGRLYTKERAFLYSEFTPHNMGFVPAMRVGFVRDMETGGRTYLPPFAPAYPLLEKSLKIDSELDLSVVASVFPKRAEYAPACDYEGCYNGRLTNGSACPSCKGTGVKVANSAQTIIQIPLPANPADMVNLDNLTSYKAPPTDLLTWMDERIDKLGEAAIKTVMNSDIFSRSEIAETATGKNIQLQNAYDYLFFVAENYSLFWQHLVYTCAGFLAQLDGLTAERIFSRDFKMQDLAGLYAELEAANRAGAGREERIMISRRIIEHLHVDEPERVEEWKRGELINPFSGYSDTQIAAALASDLVPRMTKARYLMLGEVTRIVKQRLQEIGGSLSEAADELIMELAEQATTEILQQADASRPTLTVPLGA